MIVSGRGKSSKSFSLAELILIPLHPIADIYTINICISSLFQSPQSYEAQRSSTKLVPHHTEVNETINIALKDFIVLWEIKVNFM